MYTLKAILHVIWMIILPLLIGNLIYYIIGSFIAWDLDPRDWQIFLHWPGRFIVVLLEIFALSFVPKFWEEFDL